MNPKNAKKTLLVSLLVSVLVVTVARARGGQLPEPRQYIGMGSAFFLAAVLVEVAPPLGAGFAILLALSLALRHGEKALEGLIGAQSAARRFAQPRASVVPSLNLQPSGSGFQAMPSAKGKWGSAQAACQRITRHARNAGLLRTSAKRAKILTSSGGVSDHSLTCKACYAEDWGGLPSMMDSAAQNIARELGRNWNPPGPLEITAMVDGYRIQVLYRTMTGGNHFDHIHVGARLASYTP